MVKWKVENVYGRKTELKPITSVEFFTLVQRPSMIATILHRRNEMYDYDYLGSLLGLLLVF